VFRVLKPYLRPLMLAKLDPRMRKGKGQVSPCRTT
jgi:hypothetical protein